MFNVGTTFENKYGTHQCSCYPNRRILPHISLTQVHKRFVFTKCESGCQRRYSVHNHCAEGVWSIRHNTLTCLWAHCIHTRRFYRDIEYAGDTVSILASIRVFRHLVFNFGSYVLIQFQLHFDQNGKKDRQNEVLIARTGLWISSAATDMRHIIYPKMTDTPTRKAYKFALKRQFGYQPIMLRCWCSDLNFQQHPSVIIEFDCGYDIFIRVRYVSQQRKLKSSKTARKMSLVRTTPTDSLETSWTKVWRNGFEFPQNKTNYRFNKRARFHKRAMYFLRVIRVFSWSWGNDMITETKSFIRKLTKFSQRPD